MNPEPLPVIPAIRLVNKAAMAVFFEVSPQALDGFDDHLRPLLM